jgi:sulfur relay (sulfurtransferase) complex TusBCD TusD component (DsrE family)
MPVREQCLQTAWRRISENGVWLYRRYQRKGAGTGTEGYAAYCRASRLWRSANAAAMLSRMLVQVVLNKKMMIRYPLPMTFCRCAAMLLAGLFAWSAGIVTVAADEEVEKAIFLFNDGDTLTAGNAQSGQFFTLELSAREKLVEQFVANGVAIVVTNQRFAGVGTLSGGWNSLRRIAGETFISAEVRDLSAMLVTSDRLLTYYGRSGTWAQTKR